MALMVLLVYRGILVQQLDLLVDFDLLQVFAVDLVEHSLCLPYVGPLLLDRLDLLHLLCLATGLFQLSHLIH